MQRVLIRRAIMFQRHRVELEDQVIAKGAIEAQEAVLEAGKFGQQAAQGRKQGGLVAAFFLRFVFLSFQNFTAIWIPFSLTMTLLSGVLVWRIYRADTNRDFHWLSNYCKLILVLGIASMYFV